MRNFMLLSVVFFYFWFNCLLLIRCILWSNSWPFKGLSFLIWILLIIILLRMTAILMESWLVIWPLLAAQILTLIAVIWLWCSLFLIHQILLNLMIFQNLKYFLLNFLSINLNYNLVWSVSIVDHHSCVWNVLTWAFELRIHLMLSKFVVQLLSYLMIKLLFHLINCNQWVKLGRFASFTNRWASTVIKRGWI